MDEYYYIEKVQTTNLPAVHEAWILRYGDRTEREHEWSDQVYYRSEAEALAQFAAMERIDEMHREM